MRTTSSGPRDWRQRCARPSLFAARLKTHLVTVASDPKLRSARPSTRGVAALGRGEVWDIARRRPMVLYEPSSVKRTAAKGRRPVWVSDRRSGTTYPIALPPTIERACLRQIIRIRQAHYRYPLLHTNRCGRTSLRISMRAAAGVARAHPVRRRSKHRKIPGRTCRIECWRSRGIPCVAFIGISTYAKRVSNDSLWFRKRARVTRD